jgi:hypothetical protein
VFRSAVFAGSVPLAISLARNELPLNADLTVETFFVRETDWLGTLRQGGSQGLDRGGLGELTANLGGGEQVQPARHSYLPIILSQIRKQFLSLVLDDSAYASVRESECWFEGSDGAPLRWYALGATHQSGWCTAELTCLLVAGTGR